jgi:hypothetical protein
MGTNHSRTARCLRILLAVLCAVATAPDNLLASVVARGPSALQAPSSSGDASRIPPDQLDSLVAPIALYPDPLLAQTLAASTYPLEILQLQQWLAKNPGLKDKALFDAASRQSWDPSIQAMAALPDVVKRLADDIQWTTDLGNAFLAQESDVMDAVQRMRQKAEQQGNLRSTPQQTVETQVVESKSVIVIEQASPEVVYVPSYNPAAVYGPPIYPYPPIYYPPVGAYAAGMAVSFGVGVAMGAAFGGGWGWGAGWGRGDVTINRNNNFNRNANINGIRGGNAGNSWQHRAEHRGGTPYRDRATADRFGGTARGDSLANRQAGARQQVNRQGGNLRSNAVGTSGAANRAGAGGVGGRAGTSGAGARGAGARGGGTAFSGRSGAAGGGTGNRVGAGGSGSGGLGGRSSGAGISGRSGGGGGADRIGSRDLSKSTSRGSGNAFGGGTQGFNGSGARSSSQRGSSSFGSSGGGGNRSGSRAGGGSRSGGGARRGGGGGSRGGGRR